MANGVKLVVSQTKAKSLQTITLEMSRCCQSLASPTYLLIATRKKNYKIKKKQWKGNLLPFRMATCRWRKPAESKPCEKLSHFPDNHFISNRTGNECNEYLRKKKNGNFHSFFSPFDFRLRFGLVESSGKTQDFNCCWRGVRCFVPQSGKIRPTPRVGKSGWITLKHTTGSAGNALISNVIFCDFLMENTLIHFSSLFSSPVPMSSGST